MHTVVLGAGVVGVTTAYYLARRGHQVTVVDRQTGPGLETSFANGGLVTPSLSDPWAAPSAPLQMIQWLGKEDAPLLLRLRAVPGMAGWGLRFLQNCGRQRWRRNTEVVLRLAVHSRDALDRLTAETGIRYDRCDKGTLRVYRDARALEGAYVDADMYAEFGLPYRVLDRRGCVELEPALRPAAERIVGGVHYAGDRSGDAFLFTQELARLCAGLGVTFRYGTTVTALETDGDRIAGVATDAGRIAADRYVLALGSYSPLLARRIGFGLPVYPVKGYSVTVSTAGWNDAPTIPILDERRKMALTRMGDRLRLAGTAEFAGYDSRDNPRRSTALLAALAELFPDYPAREPAQHWNGLRPMTPDGRPILGASPYRNLFLNTGHGSLGWTLACGSALAVAALVEGGRPDFNLDLDGFALTRF